MPLGQTMVAVYRSWAFVQEERIQEFKTDDGVPYWYHRLVGVRLITLISSRQIKSHQVSLLLKPQ